MHQVKPQVVARPGRRRLRDEANRKRSEAAKAQPRTEDKTRVASGGGTSSAPTWVDHKSKEAAKTRTAKARASKTNRGTVESVDSEAIRGQYPGKNHRAASQKISQA
jgi:hypothetical protein